VEEKRSEAMNHILGSARYWRKNDDPDYPMCSTDEDAIYAAVYHVYFQHYKELTIDDIKECRLRFKLPEMSNEEIVEYYEFLKK